MKTVSYMCVVQKKTHLDKTFKQGTIISLENLEIYDIHIDTRLIIII